MPGSARQNPAWHRLTFLARAPGGDTVSSAHAFLLVARVKTGPIAAPVSPPTGVGVMDLEEGRRR
jgi:hypothetical protein